MSNINEIRRNKRGEKQVWLACPNCGKERWVTMINKAPRSRFCQQCAGKLSGLKIGNQKGKFNRHWKGGRYTSLDGYIAVYLEPNDEFISMTNNAHYIFLHRLIMAKHLGRDLNSNEWVHHKNGIKTDNHIENLELTTNSKHITDHNKGYQDGYNKGLIDGKDKQIQELKEEIRLLKLQSSSNNEMTCPLCGLFYQRINPNEVCPRCKGG